MYKRVLIALDLEGVNNVVGEPYQGLGKNTEQWKIAVRQAELEVNTASRALFDAGVEKVGLWDNHGGGGNVDPNALDSRIILHSHDNSLPRMSFAIGEYDCVCYFGYHTMEGTLGGVLAHTMSSKEIQYYKLNGRYIGEVDMDSYISAEYGMSSVFFCGGDRSCLQAKEVVKNIVTVITKMEISRNKAVFRDNDKLLEDIRENVTKAVKTELEPKRLLFPAVMEKSFKRVEDAEKYLARLRLANLNANYLPDTILGYDAHTVVCTICNINEFIQTI
jgi:D-amino peptidase